MAKNHHVHDHDHTEPPSDLVLRVQALESLLIEKGVVDPESIDELINNHFLNSESHQARATTRAPFRGPILVS